MVAAALPAETPYDISLSHAYCDRERIAEARDRIIKEGYTVYVDWIEDADLERASADRRTAERLRRRMRRGGALFYAVSSRAKISRWMAVGARLCRRLDRPRIRISARSPSGRLRQTDRVPNALPGGGRHQRSRSLSAPLRSQSPRRASTASACFFRPRAIFAAARPLYERALTIYEKTLGPDHPYAATVRGNRGPRKPPRLE
ncbi:MAG TPA: tetratricopeptide repeat protein [Stellaceae bacterium]|jgi:hypothetical protein